MVREDDVNGRERLWKSELAAWNWARFRRPQSRLTATSAISKGWRLPIAAVDVEAVVLEPELALPTNRTTPTTTIAPRNSELTGCAMDSPALFGGRRFDYIQVVEASRITILRLKRRVDYSVDMYRPVAYGGYTFGSSGGCF